jgi:prevent-host-death family protein
MAPRAKEGPPWAPPSAFPSAVDVTLYLDRRAARPRADFDEMTTHDHDGVMSKVGIADLKAHLSQHLRRVRGGRTITVVDRDTPVACIVPYAAETPLAVRRATRKPSQLRMPPRPPNPTDSLSVLLRDRASR